MKKRKNIQKGLGQRVETALYRHFPEEEAEEILALAKQTHESEGGDLADIVVRLSGGKLKRSAAIEKGVRKKSKKRKGVDAMNRRLPGSF